VIMSPVLISARKLNVEKLQPRGYHNGAYTLSPIVLRVNKMSFESFKYLNIVKGGVLVFDCNAGREVSKG
jgi:hypothetical protein